MPAWHSPNKRFADAAQAGLGLQCAKSRLSVSLIAAAISPGWSFPEPCSPQPPQQTFFFFFFLLQSLYLPYICYPSPSRPGGVWRSKGEEEQEICTCHLLLCSSQELSPHSAPVQHSQQQRQDQVTTSVPGHTPPELYWEAFQFGITQILIKRFDNFPLCFGW